MKWIEWVLAFLRHWMSGSWPRRVHSPYVLALMNQVQSHTMNYPDLEALRQTYLHDQRIIQGRDYGAGSVHESARKLSSIASLSLSSPARAAFLHGLVRAAGFRKVLEMGTSLGITTSYIGRALPGDGLIISLEGNNEIAGIARETFQNADATNVRLIEGPFNETLAPALQQFQPDFIIIDGDHRYESTLRYFEDALQNQSNPVTILFDDIRWSKEMLKAWEKIVRDERVTLSLDFFRFGLIFTSSTFAKQHIRIRSLL